MASSPSVSSPAPVASPTHDLPSPPSGPARIRTLVRTNGTVGFPLPLRLLTDSTKLTEMTDSTTQDRSSGLNRPAARVLTPLRLRREDVGTNPALSPGSNSASTSASVSVSGFSRSANLSPLTGPVSPRRPTQNQAAVNRLAGAVSPTRTNDLMMPSTALRQRFARAILSPTVNESFQALSLDKTETADPSGVAANHHHRQLSQLSQNSQNSQATIQAAVAAVGPPAPAGPTGHAQVTVRTSPSGPSNPYDPLPDHTLDTISASTTLTTLTWGTASSARETPLSSAAPSANFDNKSPSAGFFAASVLNTHAGHPQAGSRTGPDACFRAASSPSHAPVASFGCIRPPVESQMASYPASPDDLPGLNSLLSPKDGFSAVPGLTYQATTARTPVSIPVGGVNSAPIASPCLVHRRFDQVVDVNRLIEEMTDPYDPDPLSHSRLAKTAIGVRELSRQLQRKPIHRSVRTVLIVTKARDNLLVDQTRQLTEWLLSVDRRNMNGPTTPGAETPCAIGSSLFPGVYSGITVFVDAKLRHSRRFDAISIVGRDPARYAPRLRFWTPEMCARHAEKFDLVLTLGGDGTVLFTSWLFQQVVPPVLSFSLGSLGFLTNFEFEQHRERLAPMVRGEAGMRVSLRMRFTCTVYRAPKNKHLLPTNVPAPPSLFEDASEYIPAGLTAGEQYQVLNELVVDRGPSPYVSNLEVYGDNNLITIVQADGCIFSTPTGSTAYSLAAGGSLVHPDIPALLLTPICPHTLSFRPMLLNDTVLLRVSVPLSSRASEGAYCSFDGKSRVQLFPGDSVTISASRYPFPSVQASPTEWFDSLRGPLLWNSRTAQKGWDDKVAKSSTSSPLDSVPAEPEGFDIDFDTLSESENRSSQREYEERLVALIHDSR